jgi:oligopeptide transport system ATP-binding protein
MGGRKMMPEKFINIVGLKKHFSSSGILPGHKKVLKAVDDVSFHINRGETFGLVGESGCGKSTVARTIMRLYNPTAGKIEIDGIDIGHMNERELKPYRKKIQMIFQDPYASLDPRMTVKQIIEEPMTVHKIFPANEYKDRILQQLERVGLNESHMGKYAHEFSGGQRQRIGIARAIITEPEFVICDEPISALDVSIQAQVVNMLQDLREKLGLTYLFIAHDLAMVKYISQRMGVMYLGQLVEVCESKELYREPLHPYTKGLMSAIPIADPIKARMKHEISISGEIPSPLNPPPGCRFSTRCKFCKAICKEQSPVLKEVASNHFVACHLY